MLLDRTQLTHDNIKSCANTQMILGNAGVFGGGVKPLRGRQKAYGELAAPVWGRTLIYNSYGNLMYSVPDMISKLEDEIDFTQVDEIIAKYEGQPDALIEVLHQCQEAFGYVPQEVQRRVAGGLDVPHNRVYGVVTFYNLFTLIPKGRHTINVCLGTSCYVRGGRRILDALRDLLNIDDGGTTNDKRFSLEVVRCVGACALSPVVTIDKDLYSHVTTTKIPEILAKYE